MKTNTVKFIKRSTFTAAAAIAAVAVTGCYNPNGTPNNTESGALAGGAFGAASGAIIGSASHSAGEGALIGAAAGTILGGLIGNSADQQQAERLREQNPQTYARAQQGTPLSQNDVKALSKAGLSDDTIIAQIVNSHTVYHLNATDIIDLHANGVSQRVIDYMVNSQNTVTPPPTDVVVATPPPPAPMEVVPPLPGPGYLWINGEWVWNNGWYWQTGYWGFPPAPGVIWVGGFWGGGRYHPGHWRR